MLHVPQVSTWGRYCLHFAAAALETHGRRETASPLPGAHVAADIRGAAPGRMSAPPPPRCSVWRQAESKLEKKLFSEARRPLRLVHVLLKRFSWIMHSGEEETFLP